MTGAEALSFFADKRRDSGPPAGERLSGFTLHATRCSAAKRSQEDERNERRRDRNRRRACRAGKQRRVVLRVARRGVRQRVEREGKGPPRRAERPAPEAPRHDEER